MGILTPRLIAELRGTLSRRQEELMAELQQRESAANQETFANVAGEVPDAGDASVADLTVDLGRAERERDTSELEEVRAALQRIDSGSYGVCQECGRPISPQRLRASPTARYDFLHQQQTERGAARESTL